MEDINDIFMIQSAPKSAQIGDTVFICDWTLNDHDIDLSVITTALTAIKK